jgi:hypothetical protein
LASEILGAKELLLLGNFMHCGKLVTVFVMVRIYTSVRVRLLQCGTDIVKRITDLTTSPHIVLNVSECSGTV